MRLRNRLRPRVPYPIAAAPPELRTGRKVLLFCGSEHGGWQLGVWSDGAWRAAADPGRRLEPTHFALAGELAVKNGRWVQTLPNRRVVLSLVGGLAAVWMAMLAIGQVAYGDPWALCAPALSGSRAVGAPEGRSP